MISYIKRGGLIRKPKNDKRSRRYNVITTPHILAPVAIQGDFNPMQSKHQIMHTALMPIPYWVPEKYEDPKTKYPEYMRYLLYIGTWTTFSGVVHMIYGETITFQLSCNKWGEAVMKDCDTRYHTMKQRIVRDPNAWTKYQRKEIKRAILSRGRRA